MLAHDAELGAGIEHEFGGAVVAGHQVAAKAEKDEAALDEPAHEIAHLDQIANCRGLLADLQRAPGHLVEVIGGLVHLGQNRDDVVLDLPSLIGRGRKLEFRVNEGLAALGGRGLFERRDFPFAVTSDPDDRMKDSAHVRAEVMKIFEQAVDDERAIGGDGFDDGESVVVVAGNRLDSRDDGIGADGKEFEGRLHERKAALGRDALLMVGRRAREKPIGEGSDERRGIRGKVPVD